VSISASDPVSKAGVAGQLRHRPEVELLDDDGAQRAVVAIVAADEVDDDTVRMIRGHQQGGCSRVVLVATRLDDRAMLVAVEAGSAAWCAAPRPPRSAWPASPRGWRSPSAPSKTPSTT
jgi:hypothetical protein